MAGGLHVGFNKAQRAPVYTRKEVFAQGGANGALVSSVGRFFGSWRNAQIRFLIFQRIGFGSSFFFFFFSKTETRFRFLFIILGAIPVLEHTILGKL